MLNPCVAIRRGYNQVARDLRLGQSAVSIGLSLVTLFPVEPDDNEEAIVDGVDPWDEFDLLTSPPQPDSLPYPLDQQAVLDELLKDAVHAAGPDEEDEMLEMYQELRESLQRMREEGERDAEPILRESFAIGRELLCVREEMELSRLDVEIVLSSLSTLDGGKSIGPQISSAANANENIFQPIIPAPPTTDAVVLLPLSPSTLDDSTSWKSEFLGDVAMIAGTLEELEQAEQCTVVGEPEVEVERVASSEPQSSPSHVEPTSNLPVPSTSKDTASLISPASSSDSIVFPMCWRDDQSFLDDCARLARALEEVDEEEVERMLQTDARPAVPLPVLDPEANGALETGHHKPSEADEQAEDAGQPVNAEGSEEEGTAQEGTSEAEVEAIVLLRTQAAVDSPVFDVEDCSAFITPDFIPNLEATYPDSLADREYPCDDPSKGDDGESEVNNAKVEYERSLLSGRSLPENRTALSPIPEDPLEDGLPTHGSLDHLHACYQSKEWLPLLDIEPPSSEEADLGTDDGPLPATYQPEPDGEGDDGMLDMEIEEEDYGQIYSIYVGISIQSAVNTAAAETIASPSSVQQSSFNRSTTAVETPPHPCSSVEEKGKMVKVPPVTSLMAPYREQPSEANLPHSPRTEMPTHGSLEHIRTASWSKGILRLAHVATPLNSLPVSCSFP
ncbi:hypothetical protein OE88DRAFT_1418778 [Heliocybe sulcata]|uniref:Uncharacterized protein n=1 Tax=Heliocybe sulcata TaxID=5364 RepID=A0A5C3N4J1_9AGAM|nr:hypothetical protein OE88DRAFT_1418778 [Heliocybe sulcata]